MKILKEPIQSLLVLEPTVYKDERGFFMETWQKELFTNLGITEQFVQDNHSKSTKGVLRGLHYQINNPQGKLVRVTKGEVFDVAVDLRKGSSTFGEWFGEYISDENKLMMWIPPGFAHGFYVMSEYAEFQYKCTDFYSPENERCLLWNDNKVKIKWPFINKNIPILSKKDQKGKRLEDIEKIVIKPMKY
ncbi:dTDP-4-dehydrorhamnose 3,5-epimerase [Psychroflexus maritimus]|uniref:dTDP-4-dehydrorhamnose 3,5-epimerase n=1 Tax=Psychroflexus maritimus TaxID=2714865 RepID=A0A967ADH1_9FLAO|nr:dTDP-4-dehydrorhamnose 3,5-epimerase [Psychroflexus maritimus]NGZ90279.1 dTDP-4-dehydrorhamnose 3,5-epimerase [Psychroflexus maritimus]